MPHADFVHLRVRSAFSLLQSTVRVEALAKACRAAGDAGRGRHRRRQPVRGDAVLRRRQEGGRAADRRRHGGAGAPRGPAAHARPAARRRSIWCCWSRTPRATATCCACSAAPGSRPSPGPRSGSRSRSWRRSQGGLICLTGGPMGPVGAALRRGDAKLAPPHPGPSSRTAFGDRLYVELVRHGVPEEDAVEPAMLDLAYALDLPLVATNDVHFLEAAGYDAHRRADLHRRGRPGGAGGPAPADRRAPVQECGRDGRAVRRRARSDRQHPGRSPGAAPSWRRRAIRSCRPSPRTRRRRCAVRPPKAWSGGWRRSSGGPRWTRPSARRRHCPTASGWPTSSTSSRR